MEDYYELLEIEMDADQKEIKRAYKKQLRKHPPEKDPENFKKIREAYETLNDEKSRAEYDAIIKHEDEIEEYMKKGVEEYQNEDFQSAEKSFKRVLVIESSLAYARNFLGLVYSEQNRLDEAIEQFEMVVEENPENPSYLYNLGMAYKNKDEFNKAEKYLKEAYKYDKVDPGIVLSLADNYFNQQRIDKVTEVLREAINIDGSVDFEDFIYFFKMVEMYIADGKIDQAEEVLEEIEDIIPDDKEAREYAAWRFGQLAYTLFDLHAYNLSKKITGWALNIDPDNEAISDLYSASSDLDEIYTLYQELEDDDMVIDPVIGPIYFNLFSDIYDYSEEELQQFYKENMQAIDSYIQHDPEPLVNSIKRIKKRYRKLYEFSDDIKDLFDDIYKAARNNLKLFKQLDQLSNDSRVLDEFKGLISLWLDDTYTERERENALQNISQSLDNKIRRGSPEYVLRSIYRLEDNYERLYKLNQEFFRELKNDLERAANSTVTSRSSNNNSGNYNSSGCFVATAAFGTKWADEIDVLRDWRDETLQYNLLGRAFVDIYYMIGPYLANVVERSPLLKKATRKVIYSLIKWIEE